MPKTPEIARNLPGPPETGDFGIRIARDGTWHHNGTPFTRPALVRLFSTVLKRDADGGFVLETPVERGRIEVEDAPFVAVELAREGEGRDQLLRFRTNIDEWVALGPEHGLRVDGRPYIRLRPGIEARIARAPYYEMAELAEDRDGGFGVWSGGLFFPLDGVGDDA